MFRHYVLLNVQGLWDVGLQITTSEQQEPFLTFVGDEMLCLLVNQAVGRKSQNQETR